MSSVDNRIVSMTFDNARFEAGVAKTMASLGKLSESLKLLGATKGLSDIEAAANKVTLNGAGTAADKLKQKMEFSGAVKGLGDIEGAANKVTMSGAGTAADGIKGKFQGLVDSATTGLTALKDKLSFPGAESAFSSISSAANKVTFGGLSSAIESVKGKLGFSGTADRTFSEIEAHSSRVKFGGINTAVTEVSKQFSIVEGAAAVALGGIVSKAAIAGASLAKSLTVSPITGGLHEYETNLNSIQTILSNTQASGATLKDVNKALNDLNHYSDKTIYNFSEMAKNIGTFTAAGVDLKTSTESIKGIANLAALSGSNSAQASTAMYQLSQAIASGKVGLQDWNSVVNAGMGGTTFQRALATTATQMGTLKDSALKLSGPMKNVKIDGESFRDSIAAKPGEKSWLTSDVLTNTLKQFTGDLSDAQLKAMGFNAAQIKSIQATATTAQQAATQVKTLGQVFDVAKETVGSGWATTFQTIFGNFTQAKTTFTALSNVINGFINTNANARNAVLKDWAALGGRTALIEGIKNVFKALIAVITPIKEAFREIFPATTGKQLADLSKRFENFTEKLKIGPETAKNLKNTFAGFFAALDIGKQVITGFLGVIGNLFSSATSGSGGILKITGGLGGLVVAADKAIKNGSGLTKFFDGLTKVLEIPIKLLGAVASAIGGIFGTYDKSSADGLVKSVDHMGGSLKPLGSALDTVGGAWDRFIAAIDKVKSQIAPALKSVAGAFGGFGHTVAEALQNADFSAVFTVIQTALVGGIFLTIKKALGGGLKVDFGQGVLKGLSGVLGGLKDSLVSLQTAVKAETLYKIAAALALLAVAVLGLSTIDSKSLAKSMTAIAVGLAQLLAAMSLLGKIGGSAGMLKAPFIASSLVILAVAIDALAVAVLIFSRFNWEELAKGLAGVAGVLVAVGAGVRLIPPSIALTGLALIPLAAGLILIAGAVKIFGSMDLKSMAKGLGGIGAALAIIGVALQLIPLDVLIIGPSLIAVAVALTMLAGAVLAFGSMNLSTLAKGIGGIAVALVAIGLAISAIPATVALQAAGLILVGIALTSIAAAVGLMGSLDLSTLAKGIAGIGASLLVLAGGLTLMSGTLPGAAALLAASAALTLLVPVIGILGTMKFSTIAKGLGAIALTMGVLAVAGLVAAPGIAAIGLALLPLGLGIAAVSGGVYLLAKGFSILGSDGAKGLAILVAALATLVAILPNMIIGFIKGLVQIVTEIAKLAPDVAVAMGKIIISLLDVAIKAAPKMGEAAVAIIAALLNVLVTSTPAVVQGGFNILVSFLKGISDNIGRVITTAAEVIGKFLASVVSLLPKIIANGAALVVSFVTGIGNQAEKVIAAAANTVVSFLSGVTNGLPKVISSAAKLVTTFVTEIGVHAPEVVLAGLKMINRILEGLADSDQLGKVVASGTKIVGKLIVAVGEAAGDLVDKGAEAVIKFIDGVSAAIKKHSGELGRAGADLGIAIVQGAINGMTSMAGELVRKATGIFDAIPKGVKKLLGINSPSRVFADVGRSIIEGTTLGIDSDAHLAHDSIRSATLGIIDTMESTLRAVPDILDGMVDLDPVITPVLDLSSVEASAKRLGDLTNVVPITAATSYSQASSISADRQAAAGNDSSSRGISQTSIELTQINNSPESLSTAEIYRQTQNQLAQAKSALGVAS